jgi:uncharacterized protein (DUF1501 family)
MTPRWTRRRFLQHAGIAALAAGVPAFALAPRRAGAAPPANPVLVLVHLEGGNDGLNTVVPLDNFGEPQRAFYDILRPNLRVPVSQLAATLIGEDPEIGTGLALHPAMTGLASVYDMGKLAVIQGVGFADSPRSHAEAAGAWFAGDPAGFAGTGWAGRWADGAFDPDTTASLGFALGATPALGGSLTGSLALRSLDELALPDDPAFPDLPARRLVWEEIYAADASDSALTARVRALGAGVLANTDLAASIGLDWGSALESGASDLHHQLHQTVSIVRHDELLPDAASGWRVFHLTHSGYATHAEQGAAGADAKHAAKLAELSDALEKLWTDLVALGVQDRVLVLVYSEFGRRAGQNSGSGDAGTDNGAAGPVLALGGLVVGGVYGRLPALTALDALGALPPHTDFRQVYATVLERFLGADPDLLLPGGPFELVPFLPA